MRLLITGLLAATCLALQQPQLPRRAVLGTAASTLAVAPLASFADDGAWAVHTGPFTDAFFQDGFKTSATGFLYKFVEPGTGEKPVNMQQVFVHYTGYLLDGTKFDSSYGKDPFKFRLGKGKVCAPRVEARLLPLGFSPVAALHRSSSGGRPLSAACSRARRSS